MINGLFSFTSQELNPWFDAVWPRLREEVKKTVPLWLHRQTSSWLMPGYLAYSPLHNLRSAFQAQKRMTMIHAATCPSWQGIVLPAIRKIWRLHWQVVWGQRRSLFTGCCVSLWWPAKLWALRQNSKVYFLPYSFSSWSLASLSSGWQERGGGRLSLFN